MGECDPPASSLGSCSGPSTSEEQTVPATFCAVEAFSRRTSPGDRFEFLRESTSDVTKSCGMVDGGGGGPPKGGGGGVAACRAASWACLHLARDPTPLQILHGFAEHAPFPSAA